MRIALNVDVAESVRRGKPARPVTILPVAESDLAALPQEDRELIADYLDTGSYSSPVKDADARLRRNGESAVEDIPEPTLAGIVEGLRTRLANRQRQAAEKAERELREAAERREKTLAVLRERKTDRKRVDRYAERRDGKIVVTSGYSGSGGHGLASYDWPNWPYNSDPEVERSHEAIVWIAEHEAEKSAAEAEAERLAIADLEAKERATAAEQTERLAWIETHGSERLKRCVAEGIECTAAYRDERLAFERPGWQWYQEVEGRTEYPRNPPAEAFAVLDEARKHDPKAELVHVVGRDGCYAADAQFLGDTIVFGWPDPETSDDDYDEYD